MIAGQVSYALIHGGETTAKHFCFVLSVAVELPRGFFEEQQQKGDTCATNVPCFRRNGAIVM